MNIEDALGTILLILVVPGLLFLVLVGMRAAVRLLGYREEAAVRGFEVKLDKPTDAQARNDPR